MSSSSRAPLGDVPHRLGEPHFPQMSQTAIAKPALVALGLKFSAMCKDPPPPWSFAHHGGVGVRRSHGFPGPTPPGPTLGSPCSVTLRSPQKARVLWEAEPCCGPSRVAAPRRARLGTLDP